MKQKLWLAFALVLVLSQAAALLLDSFVSWHVVARAAIVLLFTKIISDALGRWLFRWPQHDWLYFRDYLLNELFESLQYLVLFLALWSGILIILGPEYFDLGIKNSLPHWVFSIANSALLPTMFILYSLKSSLNKSTSSERRLRRKL